MYDESLPIEVLLKQNKTSATTWKQAALIVATAVALFLMLRFHVGFAILLVAMIVADIILFKRMRLEFEYSYFCGILNIDKIMNMSSRKSLVSVNIQDDVEIIAPSGSVQLGPYRNIKAVDYSSNTEGAHTYELVTSYEKKTLRIIFEPSAEMLNAMKDAAPRKIFI